MLNLINETDSCPPIYRGDFKHDEIGFYTLSRDTIFVTVDFTVVEPTIPWKLERNLLYA